MIVLAALAAERGDAPRREAEREWDAVRRDWTRELKLYQGLSTALILRATYLSPELLGAEATWWSVLTGNPASAHEAPAPHALRFTAASEHELSFGTPEQAGRGEVTWGLRLFAGGRPCSGEVQVARVTKPGALDAAITPGTPWDTWWNVSFSQDSCGLEGPWGLEITGPLGQGRVDWDAG